MCFGLIMFLATACERYTRKSSQDLPSWLTASSDQSTCKLPCWQNITPAVTMMDEAVSTIRKIPNAEITYQDKDYVEWEDTLKKDVSGALHAQNGIVNFIVLFPVQRKLTLEALFASYGEPEYIKSYDCDIEVTMCYIALIYPKLGLYLDIFVEDKAGNAESPKFEILPNEIVYALDFFKPGLENFPNLYNLQESEVPLLWKGFGEYP